MGTRGQFLADRQQCGAEEPPGPGLDTGEWSHGHQRQPQADLIWGNGHDHEVSDKLLTGLLGKGKKWFRYGRKAKQYFARMPKLVDSKM